MVCIINIWQLKLTVISLTAIMELTGSGGATTTYGLTSSTWKYLNFINVRKLSENKMIMVSNVTISP